MPVPFTTITFTTALRDAAKTLLEGYIVDAGIKCPVYGARPRTMYAPCAFIDSIADTITLSGPLMRFQNATVEIVVVHGLFDTEDVAARRDAFVDGFSAWVLANPHAAGSETLVGDRIRITDLPNYVPGWLPEEERRSYYATNVSVEGSVTG